MQMARTIITETSLSCRKDLEITCYGDHVSYCFWSGSRGNRLVVQANKGTIEVRTIKRTWRESLKAVVKNNWKQFLGVFLYIAGKAMQYLGPNVPFLPIAGKVVETIGSALKSFDDVATDKLYKITN